MNSLAKILEHLREKGSRYAVIYRAGNKAVIAARMLCCVRESRKKKKKNNNDGMCAEVAMEFGCTTFFRLQLAKQQL